MSQHRDNENNLPVLEAPKEAVTHVVDTSEGLNDAVSALADGTGPIALDTERAGAFRYSDKAYLIQLRREGAGTILVDPVPFEGGLLQPLDNLLSQTEWILHAATQDLPCLVEAGLIPEKLFDTELAGRLLGFPRVGLTSIIEYYFGVHLLKAYSDADWSKRPLPKDWLNYAALDVELLIPLREKMIDDLVAAGKEQWAKEEFDFIVAHCQDEKQAVPDPWRRTSGIHQVRSARGAGLVRELWTARDEIAKAEDLSPSKVLPDKGISALAALIRSDKDSVPSRTQMHKIRFFNRPTAKKYEQVWLDALQTVSQLPREELPSPRRRSPGSLNPRSWEKTDPAAFARWSIARPGTVELAEELNLPVENLIAPDALKQLVLEPEQPITPESVDAQLASLEVRPWQRKILAKPLAEWMEQGKKVS